MGDTEDPTQDLGSSPEAGNIEATQTPDFMNEKIFERNRLHARAYYIPDTSVCLNGTWQFNLATMPKLAPACRTLKDAIWQPIIVPGHWQLQGHGNPHYTNHIYPFPVCPPYVPTENATGSYLRSFEIPPSWTGDAQLRLRFDGVDSAFHVFLNGQFVGYSQGSRNPAEFDISKVAKRSSPNELLVRVYQWCDGSYIEDQDQWWLSGIFRDVHVLAFPSSRIEDFCLRTEFDKEYLDATLSVDLDLNLRESCELTIALQSTDQVSTVVQSFVNVSSDTRSFHAKFPVPKPRKWTAETPFLYDLEIGLNNHGNAIQKIVHRIGFRQVRLKAGLLTVNGVPILLRGVNRHDHDAHLGRAVTKDHVRRDLYLMKQHNINAIRCSHYPAHPSLYQMCDELGFWVLDEADLECHGFYDALIEPLNLLGSLDEEAKAAAFKQAAEFTSNNSSWRAAYIDRIDQVIHRDRNYTSVIIWSLGNEAYYGSNHKAMYDFAKHLDPTRLIHYEGDTQAVTADMYSYMYPSVEKMLSLLKVTSIEKPIVLCEYAHALGNGPGMMEDYQREFRQHRRLQGGFIWEWASHGLWKKSEAKDRTEGFYAYGGEFGDHPHNGYYNMDGLCHSDHTPTRGLLEVKQVFSPVHASVDLRKGAFLVENGHDFVDLSGYRLEFKVECYSQRTTLITKGSLEVPDVAAGQTESISFPPGLVSNLSDEPGECWITGKFLLKESCQWAQAGHQISWFQHKLSDSQPLAAVRLDEVPETTHAELVCNFERSACEIRTEEFVLTFSRDHGNITQWKWRGEELLDSTSVPLRIGFWRSPTNNDAAPTRTKAWRAWGLDAFTTQLRDFNVCQNSHNEILVVVVKRLGPPILAWGYEVTETYRIARNGTIVIKTRATLECPGPRDIPRIGWELTAKPSYNQVRWFGLGPEESYKDKKAATRVGIWNADIRQLHTQYEVPQENGNRTDTTWVSLMSSKGLGLRISMRNANGEPRLLQWAASCYTAAELERAAHQMDLRASEAVHWRFDYDCTGVGTGGLAGPGFRERDTVPCHDFEFELVMEPLASF